MQIVKTLTRIHKYRYLASVFQLSCNRVEAFYEVKLFCGFTKVFIR